MTEKKRNTNAQTEHSKKLRTASALKSQKESMSSGEVEQMLLRGKSEFIQNINGCLGSLDGSSNAEKVSFLVDFYNQHPNRIVDK